MQQSHDNHDGRHTGKFFEEFIELLPGGSAKCHGCRIVEASNGRPLGVAGIQKFQLIENVELFRGPKQIVLKASPRRPRMIQTMLQRVEGAA